MKKLSIAIIGGSIAGTIGAILLSRAGHDVHVFERSKRGLIGRGGGVTTSRSVLKSLMEQDILDRDFPFTPFDELKLAKLRDDAPYLGRCAFTRPIDMGCVHWSGLWESLRMRVDDTRYHRGMTLVKAAQNGGDKVSLTFEDGALRECDLVLFADGYQSMGRKLLFPECEIEYRGYLVYRGVLGDDEVSDHTPLSDHPRYSLKSMQGSFVSFVVPSRTGSTVPGQRTINWAAYIPMDESQLGTFMKDRDGVLRQGSIPAGALRLEEDERLKALMHEQLPQYYADIISKSVDNQIQLIYTCKLPAYAKGRMALIGDAGMIVQPMTGAGVFKGYTNVLDLINTFERYDDLSLAIDAWSVEQTRIAHAMLDMGMEMERAFIFDTIDLANATSAQCEAWWQDSIHLPDEFSYFARPDLA